MSEENRENSNDFAALVNVEKYAATQGIILTDEHKKWIKRDLEVKIRNNPALKLQEKALLEKHEDLSLEKQLGKVFSAVSLEESKREKLLESMLVKLQNEKKTGTQTSLLPEKMIQKKTSFSSTSFLVANGMVTAALVLFGICTYHLYFAPLTPVAVDIRGYVEEQKKSYAEGKINSEQLRLNMDHLEDVVGQISSRRPVIMADAIIKNVEVVKL